MEIAKKNNYRIALQYKMFLLNETRINYFEMKKVFTIQNVPIKSFAFNG